MIRIHLNIDHVAEKFTLQWAHTNYPPIFGIQFIIIDQPYKTQNVSIPALRIILIMVLSWSD